MRRDAQETGCSSHFQAAEDWEQTTFPRSIVYALKLGLVTPHAIIGGSTRLVLDLLSDGCEEALK